MKVFRTVWLAMLVIMLGVGLVFAMQHEASVEKGKALFNDPKLGTTGKSCAANECHPNGKGLEKAGAKADLENIVNTCITKGIKGKALDVKSVEMQSLILYIKSVGSQSTTAPKKAPVGC